MPFFYLRRLTSPSRTEEGNRHVARYLAFVAGAANAGGFLAVHQYTSHVSGMVAAAADNLASGSAWLAFRGLIAVVAFFLGACASTILIRWGKDHQLHSRYALPLLSEALILAVFAFAGGRLVNFHLLSAVVALCFSMGLQNAMITKISDSVIRTTHLTGLVTDIGIAIGRISYASADTDVDMRKEMSTLRLLVSLVALFFVGGVMGAFGFKPAGFLFTLPLAGILLLLAILPLLDDLRGA